MALSTTGVASLALLSPKTPMTVIITSLAVLGLGYGLFSSPNTNAIMSSVARQDLGIASGIVSTMPGSRPDDQPCHRNGGLLGPDTERSPHPRGVPAIAAERDRRIHGIHSPRTRRDMGLLHPRQGSPSGKRPQDLTAQGVTPGQIARPDTRGLHGGAYGNARKPGRSEPIPGAIILELPR